MSVVSSIDVTTYPGIAASATVTYHAASRFPPLIRYPNRAPTSINTADAITAGSFTDHTYVPNTLVLAKIAHATPGPFV